MRPSILHLAILLLLSAPLFAKTQEPTSVAEAFLNGYVSQIESDHDARTWVANSDLVTSRFKKSYSRAMRSDFIDSDPVLMAQDTPTRGFRGAKTSVDGDNASVILTAKYGTEDHQLQVTLRFTGVGWQVDAIERH